MHASDAFVNGAGEQRRADRRKTENLDLLNTLLSGTAGTAKRGEPAVQPGKRTADPDRGKASSPKAGGITALRARPATVDPGA